MRKRVAIAAAGLMAVLLAGSLGSADGTAAAAGKAATLPPLTAYVSNHDSGTVTPIRLRTRKILKPVKVGRFPSAVAITPDGRIVCVINPASQGIAIAP